MELFIDDRAGCTAGNHRGVSLEIAGQLFGLGREILHTLGQLLVGNAKLQRIFRNIDADDIGRGCLSKNIYRKVHSIYVTVDGQTKNLKYDFSDVMKQLKDLHISVKYVF